MILNFEDFYIYTKYCYIYWSILPYYAGTKVYAIIKELKPR